MKKVLTISGLLALAAAWWQRSRVVPAVKNAAGKAKKAAANRKK